MAVVIVKKKNPPRYACKRCKCEIGVSAHPEKIVCAVGDATSHTIWGDEDPVAFNPDCECRCHDVWRIVYGKSTPRLDKMAAKWNARVIENVPKLPDRRERDTDDGDLW